ncbi:MAG: transglycosylase domain-containing protein [Litorilinea sp.]
MLTRSVDYYLAAYREEYSVRTRVGETPQAIAEAYLREYQPGPLPRVFETTYVFDRHGELLAEIAEEGYRTWVPLARISPHVIDAVVATEDSSFFQNAGYDPRRILGAVIQNAEAGDVVSGASTITMQLARHLFFSVELRFDQSMDRKAYEALLAQDLTKLYTKNEILEMYLNLVHFGRTAYGIEAASQLYFGKRASELDLVEATLLSGLPQAPGDYDLLRNLEGAKQRQRIVLDLMVRHGYLGADEADAAFAQEPDLQADSPTPAVRRAPHFVQYVIQTLGQEMDGIDVRRSGMRIYTTLDLRMHNLAQAIVTEQVAVLQPRYDLSNAALVVMKPGTAEILAMVGSADFDNVGISGQVNVANRLRQPGSAIKPMLYALALNDQMVSPATVIWDLEAAYRISETDTYRPRNYDETFHGPVTIRAALANSYNIPAVKVLDGLGVGRMLEGSRQMGLQSLNRDLSWYGLSLTLGGGEVTLLDLTTAFHTLANAGGYVPPQGVMFTDGAPQGRNFLLGDPDPRPVISPEAAFLTTHIMQDNEARTPAFGANSQLRLSRPAAAKTGTTTDWRDNWTMGYTRYLVTGVWAGNSDGRPMRNVSGVTGAAPIWQAFMEAVIADPVLLARLGAPDDPAAWEFEPPSGVVNLPISCAAQVRCTETEYFMESWVEALGELGPVGDSMLQGPVRTVYVNRGQGDQPVGACWTNGQGNVRTLHRMPMGIGGNLPSAAPIDALVELNSNPPSARNEETPTQRIRQEQQAVLNWSARNGAPLNFGPCDEVELAVLAIFGANAVARVGEYVDAVAAAEATATPAPPVQQQAQAAPPPPPAAPSSHFDVMGVAHDNSCGGVFVLGLVGNASGGLIPGIRVVMTDSLGNRVETATSGDAATFGSFRIPVQQSEQAHDIYVSLYNAAGAAVGGPAHIQHRQGGASDLPCHHVIWRGVD